MAFSDIVDVASEVVDFAQDPLGEFIANLRPTNTIGNLGGVGFQDDGVGAMSDSDRRLNIIRSRSAKTLYDTKGASGGNYTSDRGVITTMKLLKHEGFDPYALVKSSGKATDVDVTPDVGNLLSGSFVNFFVTNFSTVYSEKTQIMQTFGDNEVVYYFGKQPIIMNIQGLLFDSMENDWFSKFLTLYANILRGTQLAKNFGLVEITFPNMVVTGTISEFGHQQSSDRDTDIPFSMQFIVKDLIPLPCIIPSGVPGTLVGDLIDFKANRTGVAGYSISSGTLGGGFFDPITTVIGDATDALAGFMGGDSILVPNVGGALNSFRTSIFTPVFGVISSITKIVKTVTGSISSIISSFTNPVNRILRDIMNISTQATSVALLIESSVNDVINIPLRTVTNFNNTIRSLKSTAGTISRMPENISQTLQRLVGGGRVKRGAAILSSGKNRNKSKTAVLSSGTPYMPNKSNTL